MWRAADDRVLAIAGQTSDYAIQPRGEYVFGIVADQPMRSRRRREHRLVAPGQLVAWDPSAAHRGTAVDGRPWTSRLIIVEAAGLDAIAGDEESLIAAVVDDAQLARAFVKLHLALETPASHLERDERLAEWLRALVDRSPSSPTPPETLTPHDSEPCAARAITSPSSRWPTSASTSSPLRPASASSASSDSFATAPA
jgi:hypothetical protein